MCTIFDDEARKLLKTLVLDLLESLQGDVDDVPKVIQELYGKLFIFRFKLNEINVTEGRQGYLAKKAFIHDDKLEKIFKDGQENKVSNTSFHVFIFNLFCNVLLYFSN
jgi:hypothetical protein